MIGNKYPLVTNCPKQTANRVTGGCLFCEVTMKTVEERFWEKVDKRGPDECWEWQAAKFTSGYGNFYYQGSNTIASRAAYEIFVGPIPDGLQVCHHCDNPPCVNLNHLFVGTREDNIEDARIKGRLNSSRCVGEDNGQSKLTANEVIEIRKIAAQSKMTHQEIADLYHVSLGAVQKAIYKQTWSHI